MKQLTEPRTQEIQATPSLVAVTPVTPLLTDCPKVPTLPNAANRSAFHLLAQGKAQTFPQAMRLLMRGCYEEQCAYPEDANDSTHYTALMTSAAHVYGLYTCHRQAAHTVWWRWYNALERRFGSREAASHDEGDTSYECFMEQANERIIEQLRGEAQTRGNIHFLRFAEALERGDYRALALW